MKIKTVVLFGSLLLAVPTLNAAEEPKEAKCSSEAAKCSTEVTKCSPEFTKMKELAGTWKGKANMGDGPVEITVEYRLIGNGSTVEERMFTGTPHEMVTMWYEKDGKLAMTHYCSLGNRPAMKLQSFDGKTLKLDFDPACGIDPDKENHMHALTLTFEDKDTITAKCKAMMNGKPQEDHAVTMKRVKTAA